MNRVLGEPASCFVFPFLHCMPFKELCVDRLLSAGENEYTPPFILCQQIFYFFSKIFHFFFGFFSGGFSPVPGTFLEGRQAPFRHGRPRGIPPPRGRGAGSAKTGGAWPPDDDARDWSGAQRTAAAMPRVVDLPAAGTEGLTEHGDSRTPGWPRHGRRGMEPHGGTAQSPEQVGSRHI